LTGSQPRPPLLILKTQIGGVCHCRCAGFEGIFLQDDLRITLKDQDVMSKDDTIGTLSISRVDLQQTLQHGLGFESEAEYHILHPETQQPIKGHDSKPSLVKLRFCVVRPVAGHRRGSLEYSPKHQRRGSVAIHAKAQARDTIIKDKGSTEDGYKEAFLEVTIVGGENLPRDLHGKYCYCTVTCGGRTVHTAAQLGSARPVWDEDVIIRIEEWMLAGSLAVEVRTCDSRIPIVDGDLVLGAVHVPVQQTIAADSAQGSYDLESPEGKQLGSAGKYSRLILKFKYPVRGADTLMHQAAKWRDRAQELERGGGRGFAAIQGGESVAVDSIGFYTSLEQNEVWRWHMQMDPPQALDLPELPFETAGADPRTVLKQAGLSEDGIKQIEGLFATLDDVGAGTLPCDALAQELEQMGISKTEFMDMLALTEEEKGGLPITSLTSTDLLVVLAKKPEHAITMVDHIVGPKVNIEELQVELLEARKAMKLLRSFGVLPEEGEEDNVRGKFGGDIWRRAQAKMEELVGRKVLSNASTQCDIDPFENDVFVHYIPTMKYSDGGLAGLPCESQPGKDLVKEQQSRLLMASCPDGMTKEEMKTRKDELLQIAGGKGAVGQTVHEWSYEGSRLLDAALRPSSVYASSVTHPGTHAARRYPHDYPPEGNADLLSALKNLDRAQIVRYQ